MSAWYEVLTQLRYTKGKNGVQSQLPSTLPFQDAVPEVKQVGLDLQRLRSLTNKTSGFDFFETYKSHEETAQNQDIATSEEEDSPPPYRSASVTSLSSTQDHSLSTSNPLSPQIDSVSNDFKFALQRSHVEYLNMLLYERMLPFFKGNCNNMTSANGRSVDYAGTLKNALAYGLSKELLYEWLTVILHDRKFPDNLDSTPTSDNHTCTLSEVDGKSYKTYTSRQSSTDPELDETGVGLKKNKILQKRISCINDHQVDGSQERLRRNHESDEDKSIKKGNSRTLSNIPTSASNADSHPTSNLHDIPPFRMYETESPRQNFSLTSTLPNTKKEGKVQKRNIRGIPGQSHTKSSNFSSHRPSQPNSTLGLQGDFNSESDIQTSKILLEDLQKMSFREILPYVEQYAFNHVASQYILELIGRCSEFERDTIFCKLLSCVSDLCKDVDGSLVLQKFFDCGTSQQKVILVEHLLGEVAQLSVHPCGCRMIQKALEVSTPDMQILCVGELQSRVVSCIEDQNGNHVIQKCIECMTPASIQFIIEAVEDHVFSLATNMYGCRVFQRLYENCNAERLFTITNEILKHFRPLCFDQFGNYIVQHLLEFSPDNVKENVCYLLCSNISSYSSQKFSCNVVERALQCFDTPLTSKMISVALGSPDDHNVPILFMMCDRYGNYIVQRMLQVATDEQKDQLVSKLLSETVTLQKMPYGRHILAALKRLTSDSLNCTYSNECTAFTSAQQSINSSHQSKHKPVHKLASKTSDNFTKF